MAKEV
jgi:hypothetical protein